MAPRRPYGHQPVDGGVRRGDFTGVRWGVNGGVVSTFKAIDGGAFVASLRQQPGVRVTVTARERTLGRRRRRAHRVSSRPATAAILSLRVVFL